MQKVQNSYPLLVYRKIGRQRAFKGLYLLAVALPLALLSLVFTYPAWLSGTLWAAAMGSLIYVFGTLALYNKADVSLQKDHFLVRAPFQSTQIPYRYMVMIETGSISTLYKKHQLTEEDAKAAGPLFTQAGSSVVLRRALFEQIDMTHIDKYVCNPARNEILLQVENWVELSKRLKERVLDPDELAKISASEAFQKMREESLLQPALEERLSILAIGFDKKGEGQLKKKLASFADLDLTSSGLAGLRMMRTESPAVVLVGDKLQKIEMPEFLAGARRIATKNSVPILSVGKIGGRTEKAELLEMGVNECISASVGREQLIGRVQFWLERKQRILKQRELKETTATLELMERILNKKVEPTEDGSRRSGVVNPTQAPTSLAYQGQMLTALHIELTTYKELANQGDRGALPLFLERCLAEIEPIVEENKGRIEKIENGTLTILFGVDGKGAAPLQAFQAIESAMLLKQRLLDLFVADLSGMDSPLTFKFGIHTAVCTPDRGATAAGNEHMGYVGPALDLAEQMVLLAADQNEILCSRNSIKPIYKYVQFEAKEGSRWPTQHEGERVFVIKGLQQRASAKAK